MTGSRATWLLIAVLNGAAGGIAVACATAGFTSGVGVLAVAWLLGARHAFDTDHVVAIDAAVRGQPGHRGARTGLWFSLGHCVIVAAACLALGLGARWVAEDTATGIRAMLEATGAAVAAVFLLAMGAANTLTVVRARRRGRGPATLAGRLVGPAAGPGRMFGVGLLFGLGFDTATEVSVLALSTGQAAAGAPWLLLAGLPVAFAAGMSLFDTANSALVASVYRRVGEHGAHRLRDGIILTTGVLALVLGAAGAVAWVAARRDVDVDWPGSAWLGFALAAAATLTAAVAWHASRRRAQASGQAIAR